MTIFRPNYNKKNLFFIILILIFLLIGGSFYIYEYNQIVELKHNLKILENKLNQQEVLNADLKDQLYRILEPSRLKDLAIAQGLRLNNQPIYLEIGQ